MRIIITFIGTAIILFSNTIFANTDYYFKTGATNLTVLSNWSLTTDGSGASPANFTNANQTFNIINNASVTLSSSWAVSGSLSKVVLGNGVSGITLIMTAAGSTSAPSFDVSALASLTIAGTAPNLITINTNSTITYNQAGGSQSVISATYGNLTISGSGLKTLAGNTIVNGVLTLNNTLSVTGTLILTITNDIAGTNTNLTCSTTSSLIFNGTVACNLPTNFTSIIKNLTINNSGGVNINRNLSILGTLTLTSGNFNVGAFQIALAASSSITGTIANFITTSSSSLFINGYSSPIPSSVTNLLNLTILTSTSITANLNIFGTLLLSNGSFTTAGLLTMQSGTTINRQAGSLSAEPNATTTYNLIYSATSPGTTLTGFELPTVTTKLNNLTVSGLANRQVTLTKSVTVNGNINNTLGILNFSTTLPFTVTLKGNFTNSQSNSPFLSFVSGLSKIDFNGSSSITTIDENEFNNVTVSGTLNAPVSFALKMKGDFVNTGTFTHNNGIVKFSGTTTISGASTTSFYDINILSGASLTGKSAGTFNVAHNFNNDGASFNGNNGIVGFNGTAGTITGATTTTFASIAITGTLTAPASLNLTANFDNSGTISLTSCTVNFSGAGNKDIKGSVVTTFSNINVSAGTLRVENVNANLTGSLTLSGAAIFDGDGSSNNRIFTLISNASGTARIATVPSTASVSGSITLQRFATGATPNWTLMSTPIKTRTLANWTSNFYTSGFPGSSGTAGGFISIYSDNEALATSLGDPNRYVAPTNASDPITVGKGYWVYLGDHVSGTTGNVTVSLSGTPQVNRQTSDAVFNFGITRTGGSDPGWNLIANPFPSEIDWDAASGWTKTNIDNTIYYYDETFGGDQFISYVGSPVNISEDGITNGIIPSSQAVYIQATGASPVLTCDERVKPAAHTSPTFHRSTSSNSNNPMVRMKLTNGVQNSYTVVYFFAGTSLGFDNGYDAKDFTDSVPSGSINLTSKNVSTYFSINGIPLLTGNVSIPLRALVGTSGTYTLGASAISNMDQSVCITLFDALNGTYTNLRTDSIITSFSDTATQPRFFLNFDNSNQVTFTQTITQPTCTNASNMAVVTPSGTGPFNIIWKDAGNNIIQNTLNSISSDTILNLTSGDYAVEVYNGSACGFATDVFSIDNVSQNNATFTSHDPNCNGAHNAQINAVPSGNGPYHYVWFDNNSSVIRERIGLNTPDALTNIGAGDYSVNISFNTGCMVTQSFTITEPALPVASFINIDSVDINNADSILFVNNSTDADNYEWVITGDANSYTDNDFVYTFVTEGTYTVTLTSSDNNCNSTSVTSNSVVVYAPVVTSASNNVKAATEDNDIKLLSNLDGSRIQFNYTSDKPVFITIYDALGQQLTQRLSVKPGNQIINLDLGNASSQILFINISGEEKNQTFKVFNK